jgi:hypothetical protein
MSTPTIALADRNRIPNRMKASYSANEMLFHVEQIVFDGPTKMLFHVKQNLFERGVFIRTRDWFERSLSIRMAQPCLARKTKKAAYFWPPF